jgi:hypothetical protein
MRPTLNFDFVKTVGEDQTLAGMLVVLDGIPVAWFPGLREAIEFAKELFNAKIGKAAESQTKTATVIFEREGHQVIEFDNGTDEDCLILNADGTLEPRNFDFPAAMAYVDKLLARRAD